jgi:5-hydroxyisourate hydrolase-like protein (transthyretin family)
MRGAEVMKTKLIALTIVFITSMLVSPASAQWGHPQIYTPSGEVFTAPSSSIGLPDFQIDDVYMIEVCYRKRGMEYWTFNVAVKVRNYGGNRGLMQGAIACVNMDADPATPTFARADCRYAPGAGQYTVFDLSVGDYYHHPLPSIEKAVLDRVTLMFTVDKQNLIYERNENNNTFQINGNERNRSSYCN